MSGGASGNNGLEAMREEAVPHTRHHLGDNAGGLGEEEGRPHLNPGDVEPSGCNVRRQQEGDLTLPESLQGLETGSLGHVAMQLGCNQGGRAHAHLHVYLNQLYADMRGFRQRASDSKRPPDGGRPHSPNRIFAL